MRHQKYPANLPLFVQTTPLGDQKQTQIGTFNSQT